PANRAGSKTMVSAPLPAAEPSTDLSVSAAWRASRSVTWPSPVVLSSSEVTVIMAGTARSSSASRRGRTLQRRRQVVADFLVPLSQEKNDRLGMTVPLFAVLAVVRGPHGLAVGWLCDVLGKASQEIEKKARRVAGGGASGDGPDGG